MWLIYLFTLVSSISPSTQNFEPFVMGKDAAPLRQAYKAPPNFRVIQGSPLRIHVGEDLSFQVFHEDIPGSGQIFPAGSNETADMGVMAWLGNSLYTPNFDEHPNGSAAIFNAPHWEQVFLGQVTGSGTRDFPFRVQVNVAAEDVDLTMTVTYVNGETFFRTSLDFTASTTRDMDVFFAGDIFLADNDSGIPLVFNNGVGGFDCFNQGFSIVFFPITPADAVVGDVFFEVWQNIVNGGLDNGIAGECLDNGAGLEWRNRIVGPGNPLRIDMATSFGLDINTVPTVTIRATDTQAGESGPNNGAFTFTRDLTQGDLQVFYTVSGTATNGVDFETISGSVLMSNGQGSTTLPIVPIPDNIQEGDERLTLTLRSDAGYSIGDNRSDTITIVDGPACSQPTELALSDITTNSLFVTVNLGPFGGRCLLLLGEAVIGSFETTQGGLQGINTEGLDLQPGTTYTVCCTDFCADGSEGEAVCVSATTLNEDIPPLKSPQYIRNTNFFTTEEGELGCFFPDPNVDGSDHDGSGNLVYVVTLEDPLTCEIFIGPVEIDSETWPTVVKIPADAITSPQYNIGVRRSRKAPGKRDEESDKVVIAGPDLTVVPEPDTTLEFERWLLHMPRKVGGFDGKIEIRNPNTVDAAQVLLVGYDFNGQVVDKEIETLAAQETKVFDLYGNGPNALFSDPGLEDTISHVALWDRSNLTKASLQYISQKSGYDTWVDEVNLNQEPVTGQEMEVLGSTPDNTYFTGVAVLNLAGTQATEVVAVQRDPQTRQVIAEVSLGMLGPGQKLLSVVSSAFSNFIPNAVFTIETRSDQGTATIQVLGLAGLINGDFLNSARVVFKK